MPPRRLPMFPLGSVLFPHELLPLHVFEPRYRVMIRHCLDGDREFGVVLIERGSEVGGGDARFTVGTVARIVQASELSDGRLAIAVVGLRTLRIVQWLPEEPYPVAEIDETSDAEVDQGQAAALVEVRERVFTEFARVLELWHRLDDRVPTVLPPRSRDALQDLYSVAATAPFGPLDAQRLLEAPVAKLGALLVQFLVELGEELRAHLSLE